MQISDAAIHDSVGCWRRLRLARILSVFLLRFQSKRWRFWSRCYFWDKRWQIFRWHCGNDTLVLEFTASLQFICLHCSLANFDRTDSAYFVDSGVIFAATDSIQLSARVRTSVCLSTIEYKCESGSKQSKPRVSTAAAVRCVTYLRHQCHVTLTASRVVSVRYNQQIRAHR